MTTEVSGETLALMVTDNILFNRNIPKKNPIIQYSGLYIDRTNILNAVENNTPIRDITQYIIDTNTNETINPDKIYKIANPEKYFNKSQNPQIKALKHISQYTGDTVQDLFKRHFETSTDSLIAKCDTRII
mgnify:CR=1 FL=1